MTPARPLDRRRLVAGTSALAMFALVASACGDPTLLVTTVETDLVPGEDFEAIRIVVVGAHILGEPRERTGNDLRIQADAPDLAYPFSFFVEPFDGPTADVTVQALDRRGNVLVEQAARVSFSAHRTVVLRLELTAACRFATTCPTSETCDRGGCTPRDRSEEALPEVVARRELDGLEPPPPHERPHVQRSCRDFGAMRGCGVEKIDGGSFTMGGDPDAIDPGTGVEVTVSPFLMDSFEVTSDRIAAIGRSGARFLPLYQVPYPNGDVLRVGTDQSNVGCGDRDGVAESARASTCWTWDEAARLCAIEGGRLPTSAEWEYVARHRITAGLPSPRTYPWGDVPPDDAAPCVRARYEACDASDAVGDVASLPQSGSLFDLAGNAAEWTSDTYEAVGGTCFPLGHLDDPACLPNPSRPLTTRPMIVRGGAVVRVGVEDDVEDGARRSLRGASIARVFPQLAHEALGVRCVYSR